MYGGKGAGSLLGGAVLLPNTGDNTTLTFIAVAAIAIGVSILLTTAGRLVVKKVSSKA